MGSKNIGKAIRKSAKKVIVESGIGSSRAGNKELSHLATRLSNQPIHSLESAQLLGERLGEKIVELSQTSSKKYLDKGIIRILVVTKAIPSVDDLPIATAPADGTESKTRQTSKTAVSVESLSSMDKVQPAVLPVDEAILEDETIATEAELIEDADFEIPSAQVIEAMAVEDEEDEEAAIVELLEEPTETIQAEDSTASIAADAVDDPITATELDTEEPATEIVSAP